MADPARHRRARVRVDPHAPACQERPSAGLVGGRRPVLCPVGQHRGLRLLGAYFFAINLILRRCARGDLRPKALQHHHRPRDCRRSAGLARQGRRTGLAAGGTPRRGLPHRHRPGDVPDLPPGGLSRQVGRQAHPRRGGAGLAEKPGGDRSLDRARLLDEGIANVEALANHDLIRAGLGARTDACPTQSVNAAVPAAPAPERP